MTRFLIFELKWFEYHFLLFRLTRWRGQHHPSLSTGRRLLYISLHPWWYHRPVSNLGPNRSEHITLLYGRIVVAYHLSRRFAKSWPKRSVGVWISGTCYFEGIVLVLGHSRLLALPHWVRRLVGPCTHRHLTGLRLRFSGELCLVLELRKFRAPDLICCVLRDYLAWL